jgi:hypothetical protein
MPTRKPATRKPARCKQSVRTSSAPRPSAPITIVVDEAISLWDALTDAVTAAKVRAVLPDRLQLVARPRPVSTPAGEVARATAA